MTPATTLAAYGAALVVVFGAAAAVGNAVGPVGTAATSDEHATTDHSGTTDHTEDGR